MEDIKKIAILRANAVGDFIVTLPAIQAIRDRYPSAEIVLLGKPWHKKFLIPNRTPVNRAIIVPVKKGIRDEKTLSEHADELKRFFEEMRKEKFDIAIHFQGNGMSANPFINQFNAGMTVGLTSENAEDLDRSTNFYYYQSEVLRYLEVASLIDAKTADLEPHINVLPQDEEETKGLISFLDNKPFVVLHPFATDVRRGWPVENYITVANWLREKNFKVIFTGVQEDFEVVENLISSMKHNAINACGTLSLGGLSSLLQKAALTIAADTGPLHLARAVNTPTVGLYWAPNLVNWGPLSREMHRPVISWDMTCPICGIVPNQPYPFEPQSNCKHEISFVRNISVEAVCEAAEALLFQNKKIKQNNENLILKDNEN